MNDLEAVARDLRLSVDTLKLPAELLKQGYDPSFLATYRPDELGQMDAATLAKLQRGLEYRGRLAKYKEKLRDQGAAEGWWQASLVGAVDNAESVAEVDGLTRNIRSRKSSRILAGKEPRLAELGQAILTMTDSAPSDLVAWVAERTQSSTEEAAKLWSDTKQWLQILLSEDVQLLYRLGRQILRRGNVSIKLLKEQADPETKTSKSSNQPESLPPSTESTTTDPSPTLPDAIVDDESLSASYSDLPIEPLDSSTPSTGEATEEFAVSTISNVEEVAVENEVNIVDPLLAAFPNVPAIKTRTAKVDKKLIVKPVKQLSPRQRRRKWLRSVLQRYSKMKVPLQRIGHYQALILGRGQRSQIVAIHIDYDRKAMIQSAREALCPGPHPLNGLLMEIAEESLLKIILPRLEQDIFAELEEVSHHELTEMAVRHLQDMLQQRPVRGHRILVIDAMGPKTAAVAIVDANGGVDFTGELSAISSRAEVVAQNVATLGQWIHQYRVTLVAVSNGNTRRYLIHTLSELMKQSSDSQLRWTIVDRTGADAYCETRQALLELPKIAKRFRAAVWLGWRIQDPLIELTKVDPARLRLGSYQRELPQETLEQALLQAVSASVAERGIDVWHSHEKALVCLPGVSMPLARAITALRDQYQLSTREALLESLRANASEVELRQAIGYLRLFGSDQPLDGTMIHPDDYRLAERLIAAGPLPCPPNAPESWKKPAPMNANPVEADCSIVPDQSIESTESITSVESIESVETVGTVNALVSDVPIESETAVEPIASEVPSTVPSADSNPSLAPIDPQCPTNADQPPPLTIDVERLARSWQVGRAKMRVVARGLQQPFADSRDQRDPIPLLSQVPTFDGLQAGMTAWGIVIGVADFGAFVDLGPDCNGLIHVSRLSREFVEDPHEVVQIGDLLHVWVVHVDREKKRIALSALPPGVDMARRPSAQDLPPQARTPSSSDRGRPTGQSSNYRSGQRSNDNRDSNSSQRGSDGRGRGAPSRGKGRPESSQQSHDRKRSDRREDAGQSSDKVANRPRSKPAHPATPITEAMQDGKEPLRSFSDLMQFFQTKHDEPSKTPPPPTMDSSIIKEVSETNVEESEAKPSV